MARQSITLGDIRACKTPTALEKLATEVGLTIKGAGTLGEKKQLLSEMAADAGKLHESLCAKVVAEDETLRARVEAIEMQIGELQKDVVASLQQAREAAATAARAEEAATAARQAAEAARAAAVALQAQQEEAADAPRQEALAGQAIWFNSSCGELPGGAEEQREAVCAALREAGLPEAAAARVLKVRVLGAKGKDRGAPIVLHCASLSDKIELLRAARAAGKDGKDGPALAASLTPWQQARRRALQPQRAALTAQGLEARFYQGHRLQQRADRRSPWVDVPLSSHTPPASA